MVLRLVPPIALSARRNTLSASSVRNVAHEPRASTAAQKINARNPNLSFMFAPCLFSASLVDAIAAHHLRVELDAEARRFGHFDPAVLHLRAARPHPLPDRVAVGMGEALGVGTVRDGGK